MSEPEEVDLDSLELQPVQIHSEEIKEPDEQPIEEQSNVETSSKPFDD